MKQLMPMLWGCARVPIFDNVRTRTYANAITETWIPPTCVSGYQGDSEYENDTYSIYSETYSTPADDNAWWVTDSPESKQFAGFWVHNVTGMFGPAPYKRTSVALTGSHCGRVAVWRAPEPEVRTVVVEGTALGQTCCSVMYGLQALAAVLRGCCSESCDGAPLRTIEMLAGDCAACCTPEQHDEACTCTRWVCLNNVALVEGPTVIERKNGASPCCGGNTNVQFRVVLEAADPRLHRDAVPATDLTITAGTDECDNEAFCIACPELAPLTDPNCPVLPTPALPPSLSCNCPPILQQSQWSEFTVAESLFDITANVTVQTSTNPIAKLVVRWWKKRLNLPAGDPYYTPCNTCGGFGVSYIPGSSLLRVTDTATLRTPGNITRNANKLVYSTDSRPWLGCIPLSCGDYVMQVVWEYNEAGLNPNGTVITVETVESAP